MRLSFSTRPTTRPGHLLGGLWLHISIVAIICQAFMLVIPVKAAGNANNFYFTEFDADYYLSRTDDGTSRLRVTERLTAVFPDTDQNHGLTRIIPYTNQGGTNLTMPDDQPLNLTVRHNGIVESPAQIDHEDGFYVVYLGDADTYLHGTHTYELTYEFQNVITEFSTADKNWQELYWDTNGNDWLQSFSNLTARFHLVGEDVATAFTGNAWCYVGSYGTQGSERCAITATEDGLEFTTQNLSPGENLTFDVEFRPGSFIVPTPQPDYRPLGFVIAELVVLAALLIYIFNLYRLLKPKRTAYRQTFVKPEYAPPRGFRVADLAENYLYSNQLGSSQVATLLELAVHHKVTIIQHQTTNFLGRPRNTWKIRIDSLDLTAAESTTLKILAGSTNVLTRGQEITVKNRRATNTLIQLGRDFRRFTRDRLRTAGCLETSQHLDSNGEPKIHNPSNLLGILAAIWFFVGGVGFAFIANTSSTYHPVYPAEWIYTVAFVLYLVIAFVALISVAKLSPYFAHTIKGLQYSRYLDGLKLYIKMAEAERLQFLQSVNGADTTPTGIVKLYEKLLPYAALLRLEESWLKELSYYYEQPDVSSPSWYIGIGAFSASEFSRNLAAASRSISTSAAHSTSSNFSSSSSGGGGGGFSGGGGGGGGGGGW